MTISAAAPAFDIETVRPSAPRAGWVYVVVVLTAAYILNFVDRQVINILAEPIKKELGLHDWQLGVLTGLSFALVYGIMALPIARLAERFNRPRLIAGALVVWSGSTILSSFAQGFGQLAAARIAVGVGESGYTPAAHSLITEAVPKERRALAFGIFATGLPFGSMVAMAIGGIVAAAWGWRSAFLMAGLPGLLLAAVILFTIPEPRRTAARTAAAPARFADDARYLLRKKSFVLFVFGSGLFAMSGYGIQAFLASFFFRLHGTQLDALAAQIYASFGVHLGPTAIVGPVLGIMLGLTGISSALLSGVVSDRLAARDVRFFSLVGGLPLLVGVPFMVAGFLLSGLSWSLVLIAIYYFFAGLAGPPLSACIQSLAGPTRRATASAIALLALILFGNGFGPFFVGLMSDLIGLAGFASGPSLRFALVVATLPTAVAGILFLMARRHLVDDLADSWE